MLVTISADRQVGIQPDAWDKAKQGLTIGPHPHPAVRPPGQFNNLRLIIQGKNLTVYINGQRYGKQLALPFELAPATITLGHSVNNGQPQRVEFERLAVWPTIDLKELPPVDAKKGK